MEIDGGTTSVSYFATIVFIPLHSNILNTPLRCTVYLVFGGDSSAGNSCFKTVDERRSSICAACVILTELTRAHPSNKRKLLKV